jgi:hypothetical protein
METTRPKMKRSVNCTSLITTDGNYLSPLANNIKYTPKHSTKGFQKVTHSSVNCEPLQPSGSLGVEPLDCFSCVHESVAVDTQNPVPRLLKIDSNGELRMLEIRDCKICGWSRIAITIFVFRWRTILHFRLLRILKQTYIHAHIFCTSFTNKSVSRKSQPRLKP